MRKMAYFARPMSNYGNKQDTRDLGIITSLGFNVFDITSRDVQERYSKEGMIVFTDIVSECSALFFRGCLNGLIPAGVVKEIKQAQLNNIPVVELPTLITSRAMSVEETREYLREAGER